VPERETGSVPERETGSVPERKTGSVPDADLRGVLDAVAALDITRDDFVALWLAAALHDCGMLSGHGAYVDVEDGIVISRDIIEALCPEPLRDLAYFALRHHDYIKDVFLGEVPVAVVGDGLAQLDPSRHRTALAALGLVQIAGAASLGTGRIDSFRIAIFRRCIDGSALDDASRATRAARLLATSPENMVTAANEVVGDDQDAGWHGSLDAERQTTLDRLLDHTPVHGWHRALEGVPSRERRDILVTTALRASANGADSVVIARDTHPNDGRDRVETALSGCRLLVTSLP
jgi:hypothetical protein